MEPLTSSPRPQCVGLIICSQRQPRLGPELVSWVYKFLDAHAQPQIRLETIDLNLYNLPLFDEPIIPAEVPLKSNYAHDHTVRWSETVKSFSAFIFVTPQYNGGYPASVKNALDYLYWEWYDKPAMVISYAHHGGGKGGAQLVAVLKHMKMRVVDVMPQLGIKQIDVRDGGGNIPQRAKDEWEKGKAGEDMLKGYQDLLRMLLGSKS
ncbi:hypothetical protein MMC20_006446 [Loxospora ochrophaea]|nr:hypothetical protein [Loxospora ochrophaea]